ncbi:unnamed protein product, partial [Choristocarpus tenellus]
MYSGSSGGQVLPPHYSGSDSHLAVVCKRLSKQDSTTKLKALVELQALCRYLNLICVTSASVTECTKENEGTTSSARVLGGLEVQHSCTREALGLMAPHWIFIYHRLSTEGDRRTRESVNCTLLWMMKANRKAFQPLLGSLLGPWWCAQADTAAEVATAAKDAFESVFPVKRRPDVLSRCAGDILRHLGRNLFQTQQTLQEAMGCSPEEAEKRYDRMTVSSLRALANLMEALPKEVNEALYTNHDAYKEIEEEEEEHLTYPDVINERLWSFLANPRHLVRQAAYRMVSCCCRLAPRLLDLELPRDTKVFNTEGKVQGGKEEAKAKEEGSDKNEVCCVDKRDGGVGGRGVGMSSSLVDKPHLLVRLISETEPKNHREAWEAVLLIVREFKGMWEAEEASKVVLPKVLSLLRRGAFNRSSKVSYPSFLPFIAALPYTTLLLP